mmetsp:Transcript_444/g.1171  ORF Transcript_444/g.1171 Transcript_444/m.1171 type:complete len:219 (-) Transcript_444:444-1100(-)
MRTPPVLVALRDMTACRARTRMAGVSAGNVGPAPAQHTPPSRLRNTHMPALPALLPRHAALAGLPTPKGIQKACSSLIPQNLACTGPNLVVEMRMTLQHPKEPGIRALASDQRPLVSIWHPKSLTHPGTQRASSLAALKHAHHGRDRPPQRSGPAHQRYLEFPRHWCDYPPKMQTRRRLGRLHGDWGPWHRLARPVACLGMHQNTPPLPACNRPLPRS